MNTGYLVGLWLDRELRRRGINGLKRHLALMIGGGLAGTVVTALLSGGKQRAIAYLGAKIGLLAGPAGAVVGTVAGWL